MAEDQRTLQQLQEANQQLREVTLHLRTIKKQRLLDAYEMVDPSERGVKGEVISLGGGEKEWVVRVGSGIGRASTKKEARMIAVVRSSLDPEFTGDAPVRVSETHIAAVERKRIDLLARLEEIRAVRAQCTIESFECRVNLFVP